MSDADTDVAIVGLGGHFPGAPDADALWERVRAGDDCLVDVAPSRNEPADFVRRSGRLDGVDMFDPDFFGIPRRDAAIMDPQHRHFFECAWDALESAGHVPERFDGAIGVFGGCGMNTYLLHNLMTNPQLFDQLGWFLIRHTANDKDFLTTTLSYRLDLRGPSVNVQTACSTSLVAVHLAVQSLLGFECDLALAGGSTIEFPHGNGYVYREGEVLSASGHCRAFDARSDGTVLTSGTAVVALRRLADAIADGDPILAVIKGSAINNDGTRKVGYLAPSVDGHADVVREALSVADIDARTITLLEAHGTGTAVGDPIEVAALTEAFRDHTTDSGYCRLVSTKPNIGHLDTAAGTASLIKVVQAMRHRTLPPIANHTAASDLLGIDTTPFTLSATAAPWEVDARAGGVRRAGVSSLGVGGTNAHVIVEEAPAVAPTPPAERHQVLTLSGLSGAAVDDAAARLADFLESNPDTNLADVAHTLRVGRRAMPHRRVVTVTDNAAAPAQLRAPGQARVTGQAGAEAPLVAFAFPGGGAQYVGMGAGLDRERFPVFHEVRDEGIAVTKRLGGVDLAPLFEPGADADALRQPQASLPAVFITSIALARQWMAWGIEPDAMIGHSLGEYAAAHLAGVLSLDDALSLIVTRARLIERASAGGAAMLVVPIPEADVLPILPDGLSIATVNADDECVVAGSAAHVERFEATLLARDVQPTRIPLAAAGHSALLDPILDEFAAAVRAIRLAPPTRRYVSNLTGMWITAEQVTDPQYWVDHLRNTVRFVDGLATLLDAAPTVIVELGPGQSLSSYARRTGRAAGAIPTLRHPEDGIDDTSFTMTAFGRLWTYGVDVDLGQFAGHAGTRRKLRLPTYPFQRERCWIEPGTGSAIGGAAATGSARLDAAPNRIESIDDMCWRPGWVDAPSEPAAAGAEFDTWTILGGSTVGDDLAIELGRRNRRVRRLTDVSELPDDEHVGRELVVVAGNVADVAVDPVQRFLSDAPLVVRHLAEAEQPGRLVVLTRGALGVDAPAVNPRDAMALGAVTVAPKEYPELSTALVDLDPVQPWTADLAERVVDELAAAPVMLAHRGDRRLVPTVEHVPTPAPTAPAFAAASTWFITGGLGGVGYELARHLATTYAANLVIATTEPVPEGVERERFLLEHALDHPTARRIRRLAALEALGTKVVTVTADTTDARQLHDALDRAEQLVGPLDGAIHAAGRLRDRLIETSTPEDARFVVDPKVNGALALTDELERRGARTLVLISSTSTTLAPEGQLAYVAANAVLDAMAGRHGDLRVATLGFGLWSDTGMAADTAHRAALGLPEGSSIDHPVLGEIGRDERGTITVSGRIDARHHWVVDEHRTTADVAILPGTGHLELFVAAARAAGHETVRLSEIALLEPLVVADDRPVHVRVVIDGNTIRLDSDEGTGSAWTTHSEATLVETGAVDVPPEPFDVDDALARCTLDGIDPFGASRDLLHVGPRWNPIAEAARTETEAAARLRLEIRPEDCTVWSAHPALVDVVTGLGVTLAADAQRLHVPVGYDRVVWFDRVPSDCHVAARRPIATDRERDLGVIRIDLTIADATGRVVMQIDGLQLRPIDEPAALGATQHADAPATARVGGLLAITDMIGLHPDEGTALLDRLVGGDTDRLIVSSVELETLREFGTPDEPTAEHAAPTAPASGSLEDVLAAMWSDLLGVSPIAHDADFFDLGGHSLIAIRLMSRIKRDLGVRFQLSTIFDASTVDALAARIREEHPEVEAALLGQASDETRSAATTTQSSGKRHLVTISAAGPGAPLFVVHGAGGNVLFLWSLARALAGERPIHGFQAHGIDGDDMPDGSVEQMAARYVAELRAKQPGPYLLAGYSGGGIVALEMVRQLQQAGEEVTHVVLFDSVPSGRAWPTRAERWRNVTRHAIRHGVGSVKPFVRMMVVSTVRRFVPERQHQTEEHEQQSRALGYQDVGDHGFVNLFHYFSATADRYQLGTYDVDVTVLKADLVWPAQPEDYYWTPNITGTLAVHPVPGDHHSMFFPENVPRLAAVVRDVLATIEAPSE